MIEDAEIVTAPEPQKRTVVDVKADLYDLMIKLEQIVSIHSQVQQELNDKRKELQILQG